MTLHTVTPDVLPQQYGHRTVVKKVHGKSNGEAVGNLWQT